MYITIPTHELAKSRPAISVAGESTRKGQI